MSDAETPALDASAWPTDCTRCLGLCCVAFAHQPPAGFPAFKMINTPCCHLGGGFRCQIFEGLEDHGFAVCRHYDCFGAGPVVADRMKAEQDDWTRELVAGSTSHLDGFRELARLRMLIVALRRHGGPEAETLAERLANVAEAFRSTGRVEMDQETSRLLRWHEKLISAILQPLNEGVERKGATP